MTMESSRLIEKNNFMKNLQLNVDEKEWKEDYEHNDVIKIVNFQENRRLKEAQNKFINDFLADKELAFKLHLLAEALNVCL
ncbi:uncharacterized protein METZ01_LOCUS55846 [marine metagenome]|uniref:Uncharacterized protein n=1 Tax=marine metagenome TaxID=408172 RepID=A0A381SFX9_9ZZZZ